MDTDTGYTGGQAADWEYTAAERAVRDLRDGAKGALEDGGADGLGEFLANWRAERLAAPELDAVLVDGLYEQHREDAAALLDALERYVPAETPAPLAFSVMPTGEDYTVRDWLVKDWLPAHEVGILTGRGASGKSTFALQMISNLAAGRPDFMGKGTSQQRIPCAYISYEDDTAEVARRMNRVRRYNEDSYTRAPMFFLDMTAHYRATLGGALWAVQDGAHIATTASITDYGEQVRALCEGEGVRLLVLDPIAAVYLAGENDRAQVRPFMTSWSGWARENDCTVMLIGHPPKRGGGSDDYFSGSTDWEASSRYAISLGGDKTECGYLKVKRGKLTPELKEKAALCRKHTPWTPLTLRKGNYARPNPDQVNYAHGIAQPQIFLRRDKDYGIWVDGTPDCWAEAAEEYGDDEDMD